MAPMLLTALNVARPALPVIASGALTAGRIIGFGACIGVAYGVGFWTFGRTIRSLNRVDGRIPRSNTEALRPIADSIGDTLTAGGLTATAVAPAPQAPQAQAA